MKRNTIEQHIKTTGASPATPVTFADLLAVADRQAENDRPRTEAEQAAAAEQAARESRAAELRAEAAAVLAGTIPANG